MTHRLLLLLTILLISCTALSAQTSGKIVYEDKVNLWKSLPKERVEQLKAFMPEFRTQYMELVFQEGQAVYKAHKKKEEAEVVDMRPGSRGGRGWFNRPTNDIIYQHVYDYERVEQKDFMGKLFLISGEPHEYAWKLSGETKDLGQYTAHKATYSDTTQSIEAWFVPNIPIPLGPAEFGQLPGLILYVNVDDGKRMITATDIILNVELEEPIEKPTKGKAISEEDYDTMVKEKREEMRKMYESRKRGG